MKVWCEPLLVNTWFQLYPKDNYSVLSSNDAYDFGFQFLES